MCILVGSLNGLQLTVLKSFFCSSLSPGISLGSAEINMNKGDDHRIERGCEKQKQIHCQSSPCPAYSTCKDEFDSYKCLCPPGYVGKHCVNVCSLKPCRHGQCIRNETGKGFKCVCPPQYTGKLLSLQKAGSWVFMSLILTLKKCLNLNAKIGA